VKYGAADIKNNMFLTVEEFEEEENFGYEVSTVWMRVTNLPRIFRRYDVLWAIGTMFGATQWVDMETTRKNSFSCFQVGVLNKDLVPTQMDVVMGNRYLVLMFVIEKEQQAGTAATNTLSTDGNSDQQNDDANAQGKKDNTFEKNLGGGC